VQTKLIKSVEHVMSVIRMQQSLNSTFA
jgi:hypothetical protein